MPESPFKVVIVGGSVAGLSLANMLQANNIDFVVLEAYGSIAPQVGASIGLLPHGNRILDQLGLFEKILALSTPIDRFTFRNDTGSTIVSHNGVKKSFLQRYFHQHLQPRLLADNIL
jgi:2-polyprenyl-6-methoxyphenol hydroxylase-like FAD-dependent oxidoreductase